MRIVKFRQERGPVTGGRPVTGWALLDGDVLYPVSDPFEGRTPRPTGGTVPLASVRLLAPARPGIVAGMARNGEPADRRFPPNAFLKPPGSVIGPGDPIPLPGNAGRVDAEGELAVVIGRTARHLAVGDALDAVLGYTLANDVTARDLQPGDPLQAKGYDGFTPLGPWIETDLDPGGVEIGVAIGDRHLEPGSTAGLARGVAEILVYLTSFLTLHPGDVILTGAPGGYGPLRAGETVTVVGTPDLGVLANPVVAAPAAPHSPL